MIKQLMSSSGNKQSGLATSITKAAEADAQDSKGLFGSILSSMQNIGQKEEALNEGSTKEGAPEKEESTTSKGVEQEGVNQPEVINEEAKPLNQGTSSEKEISPELEEQDSKEGTARKKVEVTGTNIHKETSSVLTEKPTNQLQKVETEGEAAKVQQVDMAKEPKLEGRLKAEQNEEKVVAKLNTASPELEKAGETKANVRSELETEVQSELKPGSKSQVEVSQKMTGSNSTSEAAVPIQSKKVEQMKAHPEAGEAEEIENPEQPDNAKKSVVRDSPAKHQLFGETVHKKSQPALEQPENKRAEKTERTSRESKPVDSAQVISEKAVEGGKELSQSLQSQKVEEVREKKFRENYSFSGRKELNMERLALITHSSDSKLGMASLARFETAAEFLSAKVDSNSAGLVSEEQELLLKNNLKETTEFSDNKEASVMPFARLGEIPLTNFSIKKAVLPRLTQAVQKSVSAGKATPEVWQKHSFELEDGNNIQLSTRQVDGVLQVKLVSSNTELTRLMQQYEQEIKQHLEQECQLDVNLQFNGDESGGEMSNFFRDSSSSGQQGNNIPRGFESNSTSPKNGEDTIQKSVRRFGYNQMEWTA